MTADTPKSALIAINDMLDCCAKIQKGQEVLILAEIDGLYGGDSLVDRDAIAWIQSAVQARGANASVLWIDEPATAHAWRFPPVVKAAMLGCNVLINHSFNFVVEEIAEFRGYIEEHKIWMVRNFATTAPLLCTAWAQTPYELVSEIRYQASTPFRAGQKFVLTDENGTHLEGEVIDPARKAGVPGMPYASRREQASHYLPWPEWVVPPINLINTSGTFIFESMLSWWSRYIGISPYFSKPIRVNVKNNRILKIEGGDEAAVLNAFLASMKDRVGEGVYAFDTFHFGVHPQAMVGPHQCPNPLYRRVIEHSHTCNLHAHIGTAPSNPKYPYWMHCTGDIRKPTLKVGDTLVFDKGHLFALDNPTVKAIAAKYPGRPGLGTEPRSF